MSGRSFFASVVLIFGTSAAAGPVSPWNGHDQRPTPAVEARFHHEVSALMAVRHPNCALFMGCCTLPRHGRYYIVSEYLRNGSVYDLIHGRNQDEFLGSPPYAPLYYPRPTSHCIRQLRNLHDRWSTLLPVLYSSSYGMTTKHSSTTFCCQRIQSMWRIAAGKWSVSRCAREQVASNAAWRFSTGLYIAAILGSAVL